MTSSVNINSPFAAESFSLTEIIQDCGVYGFAKSYSLESSISQCELPPFYYRGEGKKLYYHGDPLPVKSNITLLNEEFELVIVIERIKEILKIIGYTFCNDLTDLGQFRLDPSRIMYAKLTPASITPIYWPNYPPKTLDVIVTRKRLDGSNESYSTKLGTNHLSISIETLLDVVNKFPGINLFKYLLIFTGAPRGFNWKSDSPKIGEVLSLVLPNKSILLSNKVISL